jgi:dihydrofolate reductase
MFNIIVACTLKGGIGKNGDIPWKAPLDLKQFYKLTMMRPKDKINVLIMGRRTYQSIGNKPLKDRVNIVVSNTLEPDERIMIAHDFDSALNISYNIKDVHNVFVIGGSEIYKEAIKHKDCENIYLTQIKDDIECDTFFPLDLLTNYNKTVLDTDIIDNNVTYDMLLYSLSKTGSREEWL